MKTLGKIRLMLRYADECRKRKCKGAACHVIDTYTGANAYLGSWFTHETDRKKALKCLAKERKHWRKEGFEVIR